MEHVFFCYPIFLFQGKQPFYIETGCYIHHFFMNDKRSGRIGFTSIRYPNIILIPASLSFTVIKPLNTLLCLF